MTDTTKTTVSARLDPRIRQFAEAAAKTLGLSLSGFAARAIGREAKRQLMAVQREERRRASAQEDRDG